MSVNGDGAHVLDPPGTHELGEVLRAILARLDSLDASVAALEVNTDALPALAAELEDYRPLLEMVKQRAERGNFAARFGKGNRT